ncbi:hypothetical protein G4O51_01570 [Candidatus Bathyarchaeota archaeon A05DMB-2]|jgi:hypothetical protein|nr:hypothetical protein [Candidatus Bathyarchaeota archaeon A05DMB-2]
MIKGENIFLLFFGSIMTLISGLLTAFIPRLAYVTIYTFSEFPLELPTPLVRYSSLEFSFHPATLGLLLASAGALTTLLSQITTAKKAMYLSSAGISLGSIGLLLSAWPRTEQHTLSISYHYVQMPWVGTIVAMIGVSMMFIGFAAKTRISRIFLLSVPILMLLYSATPIMILSNNLLLLAPASDKAMFVGILLLAGHVLMLAGALKGIEGIKAKMKTQNCS